MSKGNLLCQGVSLDNISCKHLSQKWILKWNSLLVAVFAELSESDFYYASKKLQPNFNIPLSNMFLL